MNDEERTLYDFARRKGFVEIGGSGWRRQRSDAPLVNTYRSWCDARGVPAIYLHKGSGEADEVVADLSPLRTPLQFDGAAAYCLETAPDGVVEFSASSALDAAAAADTDAVDGGESDDGLDTAAAPRAAAAEEFDLERLVDAYSEEPIYRVPMYAVVWTRPRARAKVLAKTLAERLGTAQAPKGKQAAKGRSKARGAPSVKPGRSRRHGGYGIG